MIKVNNKTIETIIRLNQTIIVETSERKINPNIALVTGTAASKTDAFKGQIIFAGYVVKKSPTRFRTNT